MKKIVILTCLLLVVGAIGHAQKVGLVLSGGGAKGAAHIGVIKALEENGIPYVLNLKTKVSRALDAYVNNQK